MKNEAEKAFKASFNLSIDRIKDILGDEVKDVKISSRLDQSPSCVVPDSSDPMANMRHMFLQMGQEMPELPLILELNPNHEMIKKLLKVEDDKVMEDSSWVLFDSAKLRKV